MSALIFLLIVGYLFYLIFLKPARRKTEPRRNAPPRVKNLVKDPVCGLYIEEEMALKLQYEGRTYYFCSEKCRDEFLESH